MSGFETQPWRLADVERPRTLVFPNRAAMGKAAAEAGAAALRRVIAERGSVSAVFASAPSQNEFLAGLAEAPGIDWSRVTAFHMDEYVGLPVEAPQAFGQFLRDRLFRAVRPGRVHYLDGNAPDPEQECARYAALLADQPLDVAFVGIGENGHIAFNDPHVADFDDPQAVKVVELDQRSREQQVHDGMFLGLDAVPRTALSMTMPAITRAPHLLCMVPGPTKAEAVRNTLRGPISTSCPASVLRRHPDATLFVDEDSAALL
ncbi:MAG: Glucosamine-6-phosphate deaminase [uncultured Chloroflexi bacterium]|uniref:Glucosamine-6-phosphate deaminase n=1 Tax=uncultured Chloroflexota bacterium TaxID=166587 RepID=A0A6J4H384_9CHLR|nr:MAG: Glucosamine-6-phosphate deaminase [uncultured Chloroflexota bacterium]